MYSLSRVLSGRGQHSGRETSNAGASLHLQIFWVSLCTLQGPADPVLPHCV